VVTRLQGDTHDSEHDAEEDEQGHADLRHLLHAAAEALRQDPGVQEQAQEPEHDGLIGQSGGGGVNVDIVAEESRHLLRALSVEGARDTVPHVAQGPALQVAVVSGHGDVGEDAEHADVLP
jgi:hypothetical protein